eukprot:14465581-Alexandrium_andersonii.AAC.1
MCIRDRLLLLLVRVDVLEGMEVLGGAALAIQAILHPGVEDLRGLHQRLEGELVMSGGEEGHALLRLQVEGTSPVE